MSLLSDLIIKDLTIYEEFSLRNFDIRALSYFFKAYAMALQITGKDEDIKLKNKIWSNLLNDRIISSKSGKNISRMQELIPRAFKTISEALKELRDRDESLGLNKGEYWKKGLIGIQIFGAE